MSPDSGQKVPKLGKKGLGLPPTKPGTNYVNVKEEDQMEISGFHQSMFQTFLTWCAIICTVGLLRLVFHWKQEWMLRCTHVACSLQKATKILLMDQYKQLFVEDVKKLYPENLMQNGGASVVPVIQPGTKGPVTTNGHTNLESPNYLLRPGPQGEFLPTSCLIYFENKKVRYLWDSEIQEFRKVRGLDRNVPIAYFHLQKGLTTQEQAHRLILYGKNSINVNVQSFFQILYQEVLEPFYVFQVFSVIVWYTDNYYYYASCIIFMSALSLAVSVYQIRKNQVTLRDTVHGIDVVKVCRGKNNYEDIPSDQIVPGDVLVIPRHGCVMQCDAVLINGNCIVNESMLTGESVPVTKTPVSLGSGSKPYHPKEDAKHTLFCGTKVIQTRYYDNEYVKAVVIRTGFLTAKGELVRSIMFPKPVDFQFNRHIHKFIICLAVLALVGFIFTVVYMVKEGISFGQIMIRALDLITIIIPPALPAAMTIGIVFAQNRLKHAQVYCISPRSINISGCINCVCFDKTGTLTEDGLDLWGVVPTHEKRFQLPSRQPSQQLEASPLLVGMATCHSLTIIDQQLTGDPLDLKMFEATEWQLEEPEIDDTAKYDIITPTIVRPKCMGQTKGLTDSMETLPYEVGIVRQFPFSSSLQRMSVITRTLGAQHFDLYCKGAPETIASLCVPETVPDDFSEVLMSYTQQGFRVLALGFRPLPRLSYTKAQRIPREELETRLNFLGLLVMENRLKEESAPVLDILRLANIRSVMITGDNMLTALSVARDCHMIENRHQVVVLSSSQEPSLGPPQLVWHFSDLARSEFIDGHTLPPKDAVSVIMDKPDKVHIALSGKTFAIMKEHYPDLLRKVAVSGTIFARMAPEQKQQLVELLQEIGYYVAMCGDGANDCGALKAAHAGISLSETEASVASPFTSKTPNISCVPALIQEGRAALVTSFGVLKYMACYSLTQFTSVIILYTRHTNFTDGEFLYFDLFLITIFVALFGRTGAFQSLDKRPPPSSLISVAPLSSLLSQVLLIAGTQVAGASLLWTQPWYKPKEKMEEDNLKCHDNYAIFATSVFQYIVLAVVFSKGAPYRKAISTNKIFLGYILLMTAFTLYLVIYPDPWLAYQFDFELNNVNVGFRVSLVSIGFAYFLLSLIVEYFLIDYLLYTKCQSCQRSVLEYQLLEKQTSGAPTWLPSSNLALCSSPMDSSSITHSETASTIVQGVDPDGRLYSPVSPSSSQLSFSAFNVINKPVSEQDVVVKTEVELPSLSKENTMEEKIINEPSPNSDEGVFTRL